MPRVPGFSKHLIRLHCESSCNCARTCVGGCTGDPVHVRRDLSLQKTHILWKPAGLFITLFFIDIQPKREASKQPRIWGAGGGPWTSTGWRPPEHGFRNNYRELQSSFHRKSFSWFPQWRRKRGKPRIIENVKISHIFHEFLNGEGSVGNPESLKMPRFPYIYFMISLMEKGAWETQKTQNHWKCKDFHAFSWFP